jgi:hypothetical protein
VVPTSELVEQVRQQRDEDGESLLDAGGGAGEVDDHGAC